MFPQNKKGWNSTFLFLLVLPLQKIQIRRNWRKKTREKVTLLSFFETRIKEQWSSHRWVASDALIQSYRTESLRGTSQPWTTQRLDSPPKVLVLEEKILVALGATCVGQPMPTCHNGEKWRDGFLGWRWGENCVNMVKLRKNCYLLGMWYKVHFPVSRHQ